MPKQETRDGLKIKKVVKSLKSIDEVTFRGGKNHGIVAIAERHGKCCPIATSTHARRMIVPWVKEVTGYDNAKQIYNALKSGGAIAYT